MSAALERLATVFVAPARGTQSRALTTVQTAGPRTVALLAPGGVLPALAGAMGLVLARRRRARCAVVVLPGGLAGLPLAPALPAAGAVARRLAADQVAATASGALVRVGDSDAARRAVAALHAGATGSEPVPVVLAVGAREPAMDSLLAEQDRVVVALPRSASPELRALAVQDAARVSRATGSAVIPALAAPAQAAAAAGLYACPSLRRVIGRSLEEPA